MDFEEALRGQLTDPKVAKSATGRRIKRILNLDEDDPRRQRVLDRMEAHARVHMGVSHTQAVNWSSKAIDWSTILDLFTKLLPLILALFGM